MNAFESVVKILLEREGFWVRSSFKVNLTKAEKVVIGKPSCPRWEIDLIAYKAAVNELRLVECKSYLDSYGVRFSSFAELDGPDRFKLFTDANLRNVVTNRAITQLVDDGSCLPSPSVTLCLAAGKIRNETDRLSLQRHFKQNGWVLWDDEWMGNALDGIATGSYENDIVSIVTKLLIRGKNRATETRDRS